MNNIKIVSFVLLCLLFLGCDSKKNDELNKEISQLNIEKSALEKENDELKKVITEYKPLRKSIIIEAYASNGYTESS